MTNIICICTCFQTQGPIPPEQFSFFWVSSGIYLQHRQCLDHASVGSLYSQHRQSLAKCEPSRLTCQPLLPPLIHFWVFIGFTKLVVWVYKGRWWSGDRLPNFFSKPIDFEFLQQETWREPSHPLNCHEKAFFTSYYWNPNWNRKWQKNPHNPHLWMFLDNQTRMFVCNPWPPP